MGRKKNSRSKKSKKNKKHRRDGSTCTAVASVATDDRPIAHFKRTKTAHDEPLSSVQTVPPLPAAEADAPAQKENLLPISKHTIHSVRIDKGTMDCNLQRHHAGPAGMWLSGCSCSDMRIQDPRTAEKAPNAPVGLMHLQIKILKSPLQLTRMCSTMMGSTMTRMNQMESSKAMQLQQLSQQLRSQPLDQVLELTHIPCHNTVVRNARVQEHV